VTLGADQVTIRMVTIPDDDGDAPQLVFDHSFERRSGR
jgi:hypothetical protein